MTALSSSNVPAGIDTDVKMAVWIIAILDRIYTGVSFNPTATETAPRVQKSIYRDGQGRITYTAQISIELDPDVESSTTGQLWDFALEMGTNTIPSDYLA